MARAGGMGTAPRNGRSARAVLWNAARPRPLLPRHCLLLLDLPQIREVDPEFSIERLVLRSFWQPTPRDSYPYLVEDGPYGQTNECSADAYGYMPQTR